MPNPPSDVEKPPPLCRRTSTLEETDLVLIHGLRGRQRHLNGRTAVVEKKHYSTAVTVVLTSPREGDDNSVLKLKNVFLKPCRQEAFDVMDFVRIKDHPEERHNGRTAIVSKVLPHQ